MNKMFWTVIGAVVVVSVLWWWMRADVVEPTSTPVPTPTAQSDVYIEELNSVDSSMDLDAEFKDIDQDTSSL